jgi:hypothetical protein
MSFIPPNPSELPFDQQQIPSLAYNAPQGSSIFIANNGKAAVVKARLKNYPKPLDARLAPDASEQTYDDCRTIQGWMKVMHRIMNAAWGNASGTDPEFLFTQDYALLPENPKSLKGVIITHETISKTPADFNGRKEIKPRIREDRTNQVTTQVQTDTGLITVASPAPQGGQWIWGQSFDVVQMFTVYGSTWQTMYDYAERFEDLMLTYSGIFIQTGLQQLTFRMQGRDALFDPPRAQEFPNKAFYYNARIERQTVANFAEIEQILIQAGIVDPTSDVSGTEQLVTTITGVPDSPIVPSGNGDAPDLTPG